MLNGTYVLIFFTLTSFIFISTGKVNERMNEQKHKKNCVIVSRDYP